MTKKKFKHLLYLSIFVLAIIHLILFSFFLSWKNDHSTVESKSSSICLEEQCWDIELAITNAEQEKWLMWREKLGESEGMLFVFDELWIHPFWMKNTLIPLDILRLDKDWTIVDTASMLPCEEDPCQTYIPQRDSIYALEIKEWQIEKYKINAGMKMEILLQE